VNGKVVIVLVIDAVQSRRVSIKLYNGRC